MVVTAAMILVVAGLIEGSFSQFSTKIVSYEIKIVVATLLFMAMTFYLFVRKPESVAHG